MALTKKAKVKAEETSERKAPVKKAPVKKAPVKKVKLEEDVPPSAILKVGDQIPVSPDSVKSHEKFRQKYGLDFILVSDDGHKLAEACGVWVLKQMYGRSYMGVLRATFLFNKKGIATHVWSKVSIDGHAADVLGKLT
ncbi:MAG: redoxin domain-containing protein [Proteobacteria bacterium]|nr:redoxin domain-containing protein [Pseudomonadota bacterium]